MKTRNTDLCLERCKPGIQNKISLTELLTGK